jgi:glucose-6-phosphate 1-epimerase
MTISDLNQRHAIAGRLQAIDGPGSAPHLIIDAPGAHAELSLQGGQLLRYGRAGEPPVLWLSREAIYAPGKAIRGGVPICWPWFGPHPSDPSLPQHGFVRTALWELRATGAEVDWTWLRVGLGDSPESRAIWPHAFDLELTVRVGPHLELDLTARNSGDTPFGCGAALHSYFSVGSLQQALVAGLEQTHYLDKVAGGEHIQEGPLAINGEIDRVYLRTAAACAIVDPALGRQVVVEKAGSQTTVVWNPGPAKARALKDFGDDEYQEMLCVETANAADDMVFLAPGTSHSLRAAVRVAS